MPSVLTPNCWHLPVTTTLKPDPSRFIVAMKKVGLNEPVATARIRYIRNNFFAAREFRDLDDLNAQADNWCQGQSADRLCPEDKTMTVKEAFAKEQPSLLPLPDDR
jgi:hypothetical protein